MSISEQNIFSSLPVCARKVYTGSTSNAADFFAGIVCKILWHSFLLQLKHKFKEVIFVIATTLDENHFSLPFEDSKASMFDPLMLWLEQVQLDETLMLELRQSGSLVCI